jgi:hypothetical protein
MAKFTYSTWCPCFPGFYNTILEAPTDAFDLLDDLEHTLKIYDMGYSLEVADSIEGARPFFEALLRHLYNSFEFNFKNYEDSVMWNFVGIVENTLNDYNIPVNIDQCELYSPQYYNFKNDSIWCDIDVDPADLLKYVKEHELEFADYIKDAYTSCDGFCSWYSSDFEDWITFLENELADTEYRDRPYKTDDICGYPSTRHGIGAVLQFILLNENKDYWQYNDYIDEMEPAYHMLEVEWKDNVIEALSTEEFFNLVKEYFNEVSKCDTYMSENPEKLPYQKYTEYRDEFIKQLIADTEKIIKKVEKSY